MESVSMVQIQQYGYEYKSHPKERLRVGTSDLEVLSEDIIYELTKTQSM